MSSLDDLRSCGLPLVLSSTVLLTKVVTAAHPKGPKDPVTTNAVADNGADGSDGSVDHLSGQWSIARLGYLPAQKKTWHQRQRGPGVPAKRVTNFSNSDLWPTWVAAPLNGP